MREEEERKKKREKKGEGVRLALSLGVTYVELCELRLYRLLVRFVARDEVMYWNALSLIGDSC